MKSRGTAGFISAAVQRIAPQESKPVPDEGHKVMDGSEPEVAVLLGMTRKVSVTRAVRRFLMAPKAGREIFVDEGTM
jgi:hypothetical protein